jgi:hypothetical protein
VIATIPGDDKPAGALVMGSQGAGLDTDEWLSFARVVGTQLGYAVALTRLAGRAEPLPERQILRKPPGTGRAAHRPRLDG